MKKMILAIFLLTVISCGDDDSSDGHEKWECQCAANCDGEEFIDDSLEACADKEGVEDWIDKQTDECKTDGEEIGCYEFSCSCTCESTGDDC